MQQKNKFNINIEYNAINKFSLETSFDMRNIIQRKNFLKTESYVCNMTQIIFLNMCMSRQKTGKIYI